MRKPAFCIYAKTKMQISCAVTAQLISAFVFAIQIVQSLHYLNPKFQASSYLLWLYSLVCVGPGRKPRRPEFSQQGSLSLGLVTFTVPDYMSCHMMILLRRYHGNLGLGLENVPHDHDVQRQTRHQNCSSSQLLPLSHLF